ncbi:MAG: hypothetical protein AAF414_09425 [Pseudomonadota bacterium]
MIRASTLALALLVGGTAQAAAQDPACEDMTVFMSNEQIIFLGDESEGAQPGDRRILNWRLHEADGGDLGSFHVVTTVLSDTDDGHLITAVGSLLFSNGEVHASITTELPDASSEARSSADAVVWAISGGTGAFTRASGTVVTGPPEDDAQSLDDWVVTIEMECPE